MGVTVAAEGSAVRQCGGALMDGREGGDGLA